MKLIKQITVIILLAACILILLENYDTLRTPFSFRFSLYFIGWRTSPLPVWLIIIIAFSLGYVVSFIPNLIQKISYKKRIKTLENELKSAGVPAVPAQSTLDQTQGQTRVSTSEKS